MTLNQMRQDAGLPELPPFGGSRADSPLYPAASSSQRFVLREPAALAVSAATAARMLGVDEKTIRRLIGAGALPSFHLSPAGNAVRIPVAALEAFIAARLAEEAR